VSGRLRTPQQTEYTGCALQRRHELVDDLIMQRLAMLPVWTSVTHGAQGKLVQTGNISGKVKIGK
jgi:hypothetical protein